MSNPAQIRKYAIILGAGASKGAMAGARTPPLDNDFLKVARERLRRPRANRGDRNAWKEFSDGLRKAGLNERTVVDWRLEQLSTYLEARANMPSLQAKAGRPADYATALSALSQVICRTLYQTNGTNSCLLHIGLFKRVNPACVITFNYDLIADQSLLEMGRLAWWLKRYGGTTVQVRSANGNRYPRRAPRLRTKDQIPLIKLHGSINWSAHNKGHGCSLVAQRMPSEDLFYDGPPDSPMIVAPVAAKMDIRRGALREAWKEASRHLRKAPGWILWGYSFPETDTVAQVLCRTALSKNRKPKPVIVVNPDPGVHRRVSRTLEKVKVSRWPSMERFLADAGAVDFSSLNS